jgi:hypothetical protein
MLDGEHDPVRRDAFPQRCATRRSSASGSAHRLRARQQGGIGRSGTLPAALLSFASNQGYLAGIGHRKSALEEPRLLPLTPLRRKSRQSGPGPSTCTRTLIKSPG